MSARKTIQINPNFFKIGGASKSKKKKKSRKRDLRASIKPNDIKKKLMNRIKSHHHNTENKEKDQENKEQFAKDFNEQLGYLEKIISSKKIKKRGEELKRQNQLKIKELSLQRKHPLRTPRRHHPLRQYYLIITIQRYP